MGRRVSGGDDKGRLHSFLVPRVHGSGGVSFNGRRGQGRFILPPHGRVPRSETEERRVWVSVEVPRPEWHNGESCMPHGGTPR